MKVRKDGHVGSLGYFELPSSIPMIAFTLAVRFMKAVDLLRFGKKKKKILEQWEYPDSFYTPHNKSFAIEPDFVLSYQEAVRIAEDDYRIPWRVHQALWCADSTRILNGDIVELGTGKGFMMAAVAHHLFERRADRRRKIWLYDLFSQPQPHDNKKAFLARYYAANSGGVEAAFSKWPPVKIVSGDIRDTLIQTAPEAISFLHVDLNDASTEVWALEHLWPRITPGATILLDDYANLGLEDQYEAMNDFMKSKNRVILTTPAGQGLVIR